MAAKWTPTLEQADVVTFGEGALLVLAGPGSGKTKVLTQRIIRLLEKYPEETFRILALTFTSKAARRMLEMVREDVGDAWRRTLIATFHAFALDVLQRHGGHIGLPPNLTIFEATEDRLALLAQAIRDEGFTQGVPERALGEALFKISRCKHELIAPASVTGQLAPGFSLRVAYEAYDQALRRQRAVDFDDLLVLCHRLFTEVPRVAALYRRMYRYILLDEAQDTNRAQYQLLKALCGAEHRNVMLVADSDQHIYGFTGANDKYLAMFKKDFSAKEKMLTVNFRSSPRIVEVANLLIQHDERRIPRSSARSYRDGAADAVQFRECEDEIAEANWVADGIEAVVSAPGLSGTPEDIALSDLAVLARNRYLLNATRAKLEAREIPVIFKTFEEDLLASTDGNLLYLTLRILHNRADLLHLEELAVGLGVDRRELEDVLDAGCQEGLSLFNWLGQRATREPWPTILAFLSKKEGTMREIGGFLEEVTKLLVGGVLQDDRELVERDVEFLRERFNQFRAGVDEAEPDLAGFLADLSLSGDAKLEGEGVRLLTVHAAKGLEFKVVWVVGLNQGSFPDYRSFGDEVKLAEERRGAYVAVTRAGYRLFLSRPCRRKMPWGEEKPQRPSQFLEEMGVSKLTNRPLGVAEKAGPY